MGVSQPSSAVQQEFRSFDRMCRHRIEIPGNEVQIQAIMKEAVALYEAACNQTDTDIISKLQKIKKSYAQVTEEKESEIAS